MNMAIVALLALALLGVALLLMRRAEDDPLSERIEQA